MSRSYLSRMSLVFVLMFAAPTSFAETAKIAPKKTVTNASEEVRFLTKEEFITFDRVSQIRYLLLLRKISVDLERFQIKTGMRMQAENDIQVDPARGLWALLLSGDRAFAQEGNPSLLLPNTRQPPSMCIYAGRLQSYSGPGGKGKCEKPKCAGEGNKGIQCNYLNTGSNSCLPLNTQNVRDATKTCVNIGATCGDRYQRDYDSFAKGGSKISDGNLEAVVTMACNPGYMAALIKYSAESPGNIRKIKEIGKNVQLGDDLEKFNDSSSKLKDYFGQVTQHCNNLVVEDRLTNQEKASSNGEYRVRKTFSKPECEALENRIAQVKQYLPASPSTITPAPSQPIAYQPPLQNFSKNLSCVAGDETVNSNLSCAGCLADSDAVQDSTRGDNYTKNGISSKYLSLLGAVAQDCAQLSKYQKQKKNLEVNVDNSIKWLTTFGHCSGDVYGWSAYDQNKALAINWNEGKTAGLERSFEDVFDIPLNDARDLFCDGLAGVSEDPSSDPTVLQNHLRQEFKYRHEGLKRVKSKEDLGTELTEYSRSGVRRCVDQAISKTKVFYARDPGPDKILPYRAKDSECRKLVSSDSSAFSAAFDDSFRREKPFVVVKDGTCYVAQGFKASSSGNTFSNREVRFVSANRDSLTVREGTANVLERITLVDSNSCPDESNRYIPVSGWRRTEGTR